MTLCPTWSGLPLICSALALLGSPCVFQLRMLSPASGPLHLLSPLLRMLFSNSSHGSYHLLRDPVGTTPAIIPSWIITICDCTFDYLSPLFFTRSKLVPQQPSLSCVWRYCPELGARICSLNTSWANSHVSWQDLNAFSPPQPLRLSTLILIK